MTMMTNSSLFFKSSVSIRFSHPNKLSSSSSFRHIFGFVILLSFMSWSRKTTLVAAHVTSHCYNYLVPISVIMSSSTTTTVRGFSHIGSRRNNNVMKSTFSNFEGRKDRITLHQSLSQNQNQSSSITIEMLEKYTVKELKEKIKDLNIPMKMSTLKIKKDYVDFLYKQYTTMANEGDMNNTQENNVAAISIASNDQQQKQQQQQQQPTPATSPRDIIFEYVLNRYPPLRELQSFGQNHITDDDQSINHEDNAVIPRKQFESILSHNPHVFKSLSGLGDLDIRQEYHPMLKSMTSSDLDIVTVGTASCVPGVTRGVSCTALRLQWRRNGNTRENSDARGSNNQGRGLVNGKSVSNVATTGGIWIFDCGESTQVCH